MSLQLDLLEKTAFLQRYKPESIDVIETQLGIAQKNIIEFISSNENKAEIRAFINKEVDSALSTFDTILNDDIKEITELAYVVTGAVVANYVSDALGESFKGWESIDKKAKDKIQNPNRYLFGNLLDKHKKQIQVGSKLKFTGVVIDGIDRGLGMQEIGRNLRNTAGLTRKNSITLARTAVFQSINDSQSEAYDYFEKEIDYYFYSAVLDSRTSDYCLNRNGKKSKVKSDIEKMLNFHWNCRSTLGLHTSMTDDILSEKRRLVLWDGKKVVHTAKTGGGTSTKFKVADIKEIPRDATPNQIFKAMGAKYQRERLGEYRYNLYKNEGYSYVDLLTKDKNRMLKVDELKKMLAKP